MVIFPVDALRENQILLYVLPPPIKIMAVLVVLVNFKVEVSEFNVNASPATLQGEVHVISHVPLPIFIAVVLVLFDLARPVAFTFMLFAVNVQ